MNKRVIIIRNAYSYDFGGGERFPVFLAKSLTGFGYNPTIISRNNTLLSFADDSDIAAIKGWWWNKQNWSGVQILLFPIYALWQCILYFWYLQVFHKIKPKVVHIQSKDDFIAATYAAKHLGIRVIWTDHADLKHIWRNLQTPLKNPVGKWVYCAAKYANTITVVSYSEMGEITPHLPLKSPIQQKMSVIYNGCADVYKKYPAPANTIFTFAVVSRLVTNKGISEAIKAFAQLHKKYENTRLIFVGDGPESEHFTTIAADNNAISFLGYLTDPYKQISGTDVFIHPTYHEGFSISLVEASMLAKPIIATSVGGNVEIIHNEDTGLLVPPKNVDALFEAMERLYTDGDLRTKLSQAARKQYVKKFVFDNITKESFIPLYD